MFGPELPEDLQHERADILSRLFREPPSSDIEAYFEGMKDGSPVPTEDAIAEGMKLCANAIGSERPKYFGETLHGIFYGNSFVEQFNKKYPKYPITQWDAEMQFLCPPSWSYNIVGGCMVLTYRGEGPFSRAMNELFLGPTTMDCGMFTVFTLGMGARSAYKDRYLDELIPVAQGQLVLTQACYRPMNDERTSGNLFRPFYDEPLYEEIAGSLEPETGIRLRSFFNDKTYINKHPAGVVRLEHVIQVGKIMILFRPGAQNILSERELEQSLMEADNAHRDLADRRQIWFWENNPDIECSRFKKSYRALAEIVKEYESRV